MIIGVVVAIVVIVGIAVFGAIEYGRRRRRAAFGAEYDVLVQQEGSTRAADKELSRRQRAYSNLELRPLGSEERARYADEWRQVQESFVDDPETAINDAEALVLQLARFRGYPGNDSESLLELLSIPHTSATAGYREAARIRQAGQTDPQGASTEDQRQAFQKYSALFNEMLAAADSGEAKARTQGSNSREMSDMEVR